MTQLLDLGVRDYYFGYIPAFWSKNHSLINSINRRCTPESQSCEKRVKSFLKNSGNKGLNLYATFNAPLYTTEQITKILSALDGLLKIGLRGAIATDLGLIITARDYFPKLEIHASCGTVCLNSGTMYFLSKLGVQRIILSRSLALKEIRELCADARGMELEIIHQDAPGYCINIDGLCTHHHTNVRPCDEQKLFAKGMPMTIPVASYSKLYWLYKYGVSHIKLLERGMTSAQLLKKHKFLITLINNLEALKPKSLNAWKKSFY
ncbi:MAG: hypothetical protein AUJ74_00365 [Candidatus Omnitrophica bacterium CG1_02_44_16]|nr:MAG: hypothetical protein AUJ74_00365 [Candidatus Omnitrophica bacterium CG1_02_44_16]